MRPRCCVEECDELAIGEVHSQWTLVDFRSYPACGPHFERVYRTVSHYLVDGERPAEMRTTLWPDEYLA